MARQEPVIHVGCPLCGHPETALVLRTRIIVTVRCNACAFQWSIGIDGLDEPVLKEVQAVILIRRLPVAH